MPGSHRAAAQVQSGEHAVEGDRPGAEHIGEMQPRLPAPEVGLHDQAECLVARAVGRGGKGKT